MKKSLLALMATAAIGMSALSAVAQDEVLSGYVAEMDWRNASYPISSYKTYSGAQTLYPVSKMDVAIQEAETYTIKELVYPISDLKPLPETGKFEVEISLGKSNEDAMTDWFPESVLTSVFSGTIDLSDATIQSDKCITIPLATEFVMSKGESLVVTMQTSVIEKFSSELYFGNPYSTSGIHTYYYTSDQGSASFDDIIAGNVQLSDITKSSSSESTTLMIRYVLGGEVGGGEILEATVAGMDYKNSSYPINSNKVGKYQGCQTLYPASSMNADLQAAPAYAVKELILPFSNHSTVTSYPTSGKVQMKIYLGTSDNITLDAFIPESELVEVFNGEIDMASPQIQSEKALRFPVDANFVVNQGKSLVVAYQHEITEAFSGLLYFGDPGAGGGTHTRYYDNATANKAFADNPGCNTSEYVTSLNIKYALADPQGGGIGDIGDIVEAKVVGGSYSTNEHPIGVNSWNLYSASQTLYPASVLDRAVKVEAYTVKELVYPLLTVPSAGKIKVTAMLATTDATSLSTAMPQDAFTVVASGVQIDFSTVTDGCLRIPLTKPYIMHKGESMVVGLLADIDEYNRPNPYPAFINGDTGVAGDHTLYRTGDGEPLGVTDVNLRTQFAGGLNLVFMIGEEEGPQPVDVVDLAATGLTAPAGDIYTGKPYDFVANVKNNGTETVENYIVEIVNVENNEVLAAVENPKSVLSMLEVSVPVSVTFEQGGNYQLAARVTLEGDEDSENDLSEPVAVDVLSLDYKAVSVTGDTEVLPGEEHTYTVTVANDGNSELTGYSVELYVVRNEIADQLIGSSYENPAIAAGNTAVFEFKHSFALAGEYGLKAVVNIEGGEPSETPVLEVSSLLEGILSPVIKEQLPKWDGSEYDLMNRAFCRREKKTASQLLYPASFFGNHQNDYQLQSLTLTVVKEEYIVEPMHVRIYMAQTDRTEGYEKSGQINTVPADEFQLVYDGLLSTEQSPEKSQEVELKLQKLFTLESGKSLVLNVEAVMQRAGYTALLLASAPTDANYLVYSYSESIYNDYNKCFVANTLPCITFGYALEPLPAVTDIEATSLSVPTEDVNAGNALNFRVYFENKGTVDIEEYTIELLSIDADGEATILQSYDGIRYLAPGQSSNQPVSYTFEEAGEYKLAARLIVEGDADETNNETPAVELTVSKMSGLENLVAEGSLSYNAAARTIDVNLGACVVSVCDLAGRAVAVYEVEGAAQLPVSLPAGVYVVNANGKALKIRI